MKRSMDPTDTRRFDVILMAQKDVATTKKQHKMNEPISKINNVPPMTNGFSYIVFTEQRYQSVFSVHCSLLAAISYHKAINESRHDWRCCRLPRHISQFETSFFLFYTLIYQTVCVHFQHNSENCLCNKRKSRSRLKIKQQQKQQKKRQHRSKS